MKKTWQAPRILVQEFEANEYVAACYDMFCKVAGDGYGKYNGDDEIFSQGLMWGGTWVEHDGQLHGKPCAEGSSYDQETGLFYEVGKPGSKVDPTSVNISNTPGPKGGFYATWVSNDANGTGAYQHYGYAVENMKGHPNHS